MQKLFSHNGKQIHYVSEWIQGKLWVHFNGKTFALEPAQSIRKFRKGQSASHNKILAPMPGKVTKVLVHEGQVVSKGQPAVVMEAMKMEYTLKAEMAGPVERVQAKVGAQVSLGDILIQITQEPE